MATIAVKIEDTKESNKYMVGVMTRLKAPSMLQNPFYGFIRRYGMGEHMNTYLIQMRPIYPDIAIYGLIPVYCAAIFHLWPLNILVLPFLLSWYLHSRSCLKHMLYFGLKKSGYKGEIYHLSNDEVVKVALCRRQI
jgi:hypothetical protein